MHILVINSGSSSIKFSIFEAAESPSQGERSSWPLVLFTGEISGVGGAALGFTFRDATGRAERDERAGAVGCADRGLAVLVVHDGPARRAVLADGPGAH